MTGVVVVKLGGSQAELAVLSDWLQAIRGAAGRVVVVPGGGAFADTVRAMQPRMGFDDDAAHDMAIMAMSQYGRALCALGGFVACDTVAQVRQALAADKVSVWSPWPMMGAEPDLFKSWRSWQVTSDTLSVYLARMLAAQHLLLVKARSAGGSAWALARDGLVDPVFPAILRLYDGITHIAGPQDAGSGLDPLPGQLVHARP